MKTYAVIVAAGKGSRFGAGMPKQFCNLGGRPLLMTTVERMASAVGVDNVVLVVDATMADFWLELCLEHGFESPTLVYGGATRLESVHNALEAIASECDDEAVVMIHDGARPLASVEFLRNMTVIPQQVDGVIPVVPVTDSLRQLAGDESSVAVERSRYVAVQTPQTFYLNPLLEAYRDVAENGYLAEGLTDDASIMEAAGVKNIALSQGEPTNIKVTNPLDLAIAETLLHNQKSL